MKIKLAITASMLALSAWSQKSYLTNYYYPVTNGWVWADSNGALTNRKFCVDYLAVNLALATNWTGFQHGSNELGYVLTNHTAQIVYRGQTNEFKLKEDVSGVATWRPAAESYFGTLTNNYSK